MATIENSLNITAANDVSAQNSAGPILEAFDAIAAKGGDPKGVAVEQFQFIMSHIRGDGLPFFEELRNFRPILRTPMATLVSRFRDVEEILHRETIFSVSRYLPRMTGVIGPFVLSQDITPRYDHDVSVLHLVVRREDLLRVKNIVAAVADEIVSNLFQTGQPADIVQTLTRKVPVRLADEYYGFSAAVDSQMMVWARACFREFFINLLDDPAVRAPAVSAGAEMRQRFDTLLAERRAPGAVAKDDVFGRLLQLQSAGEVAGLDDEGIYRALMGLFIGMVETTSQAVVQSLAILFSKPDALASAVSAAKANDDEGLARLVFEALRFAPINPMIVRVTQEDYLLAAGEPHQTLIPKGTTVFALSWSAMFDPHVVAAPQEFRLDRPANHYLHFATGMHACFGRYISQIQIPQIIKPLLKRANLRPAGPPAYDGAFPDSFKLVAGS